MYTALIMMAGTGTRMKSEKNKVLLPLQDMPVFLHSLKTFESLHMKIILVINELDYNEVKSLVNSNVKIVFGGKTRQESVYNGLKNVETKYVLIHDAARPLVSKEVILDVKNNLNENTAVLVATKVKDTIKILDNEKLLTLNRDKLIAAMTPQACLTKQIIAAHEMAIKDDLVFTDDISLIEKYTSLKIKIVFGNEENFKITTPLDFKIAQLILKG